MSDPSDTGLYQKYEVFKDGERVEEDCFVLKPGADPIAREALKEYSLWTDDNDLATDLIEWVDAIDRGGSDDG